MATPKMTRRQAEPAPARSPVPSRRPGPRTVLIAALFTLPWLLVLYLARREGPPPPAAGAAPTTSSAIVIGPIGDWGQLEMAPTVISPPLEYIPDDPDPVPTRAQWYFPQVTPDGLAAWLAEAGFPPEDLGRVMATLRPEPRVDGVMIAVDLQTVRKLSREARSRIYRRLATTGFNPRQQNAPRFFGPPEEWFRHAPLSARTMEIVSPLFYAHEGFHHFADVDLVRAEIQDTQELRRLAKRLLREKTLLVKIRVPDPARIDSVVQYWGRGGRMTDIRPIIESVAELGPEGSVDVLHLLPAFARRHLYRYPQVTLADLEKPGLSNCFWSAMNFFNRRPFDDRFLNIDHTLAVLKRDYFLVHDQLQLGDVVIYSTRDGQVYHAAVYVADGIVFGKNGASAVAPWTLLPLERLRGYFPQFAEGGRIAYYRRSGL